MFSLTGTSLAEQIASFQEQLHQNRWYYPCFVLLAALNQDGFFYKDRLAIPSITSCGHMLHYRCMQNLLSAMSSNLRNSSSVFCPVCRRLENNVAPVLTRLLINQQWRNQHVNQLCWSEDCKGKDELRACVRDVVQTDKLSKWWIRENRKVIRDTALSEQSLLKQAKPWFHTKVFHALEDYTMYSTLIQMELASRFDPNLVDNQFTPYVARYEKGHVVLETRTLSTLQQCFLSNALLHSSICRTSAGGCCSSIELTLLTHSWDPSADYEATDNEGLLSVIAMDILFQPDCAKRAGNLLNLDSSASNSEYEDEYEEDVPRMGEGTARMDEEDTLRMSEEDAPRMDEDAPRMDEEDAPRIDGDEDTPTMNPAYVVPTTEEETSDVDNSESSSTESPAPQIIPTLFHFIADNVSTHDRESIFKGHFNAMDKETVDDFDASNVPSGIQAMRALAKSHPYITTMINSLTNLEFILTHSPLTPERENMDPLLRGLFLLTTRLLELVGNMPKYEDIRNRLETLKTFTQEHPKEDEHHNEPQMMEMIQLLMDYLRIYNPSYLSHLSPVFRMVEPFQLLMERLMGFVPVELSVDRTVSCGLSCRRDVERPLLRLRYSLQSRVLPEGDLRFSSDPSHGHRAVAHRSQLHSRLLLDVFGSRQDVE